MMKIYKYFIASAVLLLAISPLAIAESEVENKMDNVRLYGQEFTLPSHAPTLDPQEISKVLTDTSSGVQKDIQSVLETLGQSVDAQRNAYESALTQVAEGIDKGGQLPAMFIRPNVDQDLSIDLKDSVYIETRDGPEANRLNYIRGELDMWVMQGDWKDNVTTYNALAGGHFPELEMSGIAALAERYASFKAVLNLDTAVRQSAEVQAAGLGRHGIVEPKLLDAGTQEPAAPSWMGNANDM